MTDAYHKLLNGTVLKMAVSFRYPSDTSLSLENLNFFTEWYCGTRKVRIEKSEHVFEDGQCYAYVDTANIGKGKLKVRLWVDIPDPSAPNGIRPEYVETCTSVTIS